MSNRYTEVHEVREIVRQELAQRVGKFQPSDLSNPVFLELLLGEFQACKQQMEKLSKITVSRSRMEDSLGIEDLYEHVSTVEKRIDEKLKKFHNALAEMSKWLDNPVELIQQKALNFKITEEKQ